MKLNHLLIDLIIGKFSNGQKPRNIVIFGAGQNGLFLKKYLEDSDNPADFFCDNNSNNHGKLIEGTPCISFEQLCQYKEDSIVFVSPHRSEEIVVKLQQHEFPSIVPSEVLKLLRFVPRQKHDASMQHFPYIGHYYSLYPDIDNIIAKSHEVFNLNKDVLDINLNEEQQLYILKQMVSLYSTIPQWKDMTVELGSTALRHRYGNLSLSAADAIGLHCMLRILKPKKMIEVGSGFTSAVTLDTNEFYLDNNIELTFIEPYSTLLKSILKDTDKICLIEKGLQDVPLDVFEKLESGDILFIDSTHVSKIDSDVNYLFFEIFPRLKGGVYIHLHDIFYPFEYPKEWIYNGMIWNELYLLRAFLQNNNNYSIVFFQNMMEQKHMDVFQEKWPMDIPIHGGSIWLKKESQ